MTKGIKVWVGLLNGGAPCGPPTNSDKDIVEHEICEQMGMTWEQCLAYGWTVEPYTLTRGHGDE